jgi:hypothetical protein
MRLRFVALGIGLLLAGCAGPGPGLTGNDTGGIIAWSPEVQPLAADMAAGHCARYAKRARITSVHPWYGDYIAFACLTDRRPPLEPERVILRSRN